MNTFVLFCFILYYVQTTLYSSKIVFKNSEETPSLFECNSDLTTKNLHNFSLILLNEIYLKNTSRSIAVSPVSVSFYK